MLYFIAWLTDFALILSVFASSRYLAEENAGPIVMGALGAAFFLGSAISNACSGRIADRIGRLRVAVRGASMLLASLAAATFIPAGSVWFYLAYTSIGISVRMIYPPVMALLGHGKSGTVKQLAYLWFCLAFNSGILSAQISGGWLFETIGPRAPLFTAMTLTFGVLVCLLSVKERSIEGRPDQSRQGKLDEGRLARAFARLTWIANFGGMFSMSILWWLFPNLVVELNISPTVHGVVLGLGRVVVMSSYCVMYFIPFWQFRFRVALIVQIIGATGLATIATAHSLPVLMMGVAALSMLMGYNYFASLYYAAKGNSNNRKGFAFGLNEASLGLGAAVGSYAGGLAASGLATRAPFFIGSGLVLALLFVQTFAYWMLVRPLRNQQQQEGDTQCLEGVVTADA